MKQFKNLTDAKTGSMNTIDLEIVRRDGFIPKPGVVFNTFKDTLVFMGLDEDCPCAVCDHDEFSDCDEAQCSCCSSLCT